MSVFYECSNDRRFQESAYLLRKHPNGLANADDRGRCNGDRKIVELARRETDLVHFKVVENVCRACWHEPARFLNNNHTMQLRLHANSYIPVKDGDTCYLFGAVASRCINCNRAWINSSEEVDTDYHLILHSSYSLSKNPERATERNLAEPFVIEVGEPRLGWTIEDPPKFSPYITETHGADLFSLDLPNKSTIEAVVENGYVTRFRTVDRRCHHCGKTPWSIDKPGGQRWTTIRKGWFIPVVIDKACYRFCDVSINCGYCKQQWANLPPGEEKRPYALLLLDTLAASLVPWSTIAPLKLHKTLVSPTKLDKDEFEKNNRYRRLMSKVIHRKTASKPEKPPGIMESYILQVSEISLSKISPVGS